MFNEELKSSYYNEDRICTCIDSDQNPALQLEALEKAGCEKIYQEKNQRLKNVLN